MLIGAAPLAVAALFGFLGVVVMLVTLLLAGWAGTGMSWREVGKYAFSFAFSAWVLVVWFSNFRHLWGVGGARRSLLVATCYLYAAVALTVTNTFHI